MPEKEKSYEWLVASGNYIPMEKMSVRHLQNAHNHVCLKELEFFNKINLFVDLRTQLEEVAEKRGITLKYPDQRHPRSGWGPYYENIRKTNAYIKDEGGARVASVESKGSLE